MHGHLRQLAIVSIARGCGFAGLGILTAMLGFANEPALALKLGGYASLLTCFVLILKAVRAASLPYSRTEVWLLLEAHRRPPAGVAQKLISQVRQEVLLRFASLAGAFAAFCLWLAFVLGMLPP